MQKVSVNSICWEGEEGKLTRVKKHKQFIRLCNGKITTNIKTIIFKVCPLINLGLVRLRAVLSLYLGSKCQKLDQKNQN